jgi:hypothetical protein
MPPVGFHRTDTTRRIRFVANVAYGGKDYGPDYDEDEADVTANFAYELVHDGRAVFIDEGSSEPDIDESIGRDQPPRKTVAPAKKPAGRK